MKEQLPPHNLEAEEAILGGVLMDREAIGRIADTLDPESFSVQAHKIIYLAALKLWAQDIPVDFMTVRTELEDNHNLEKIGGANKILHLINTTVHAVNIDEYAKLVMDKYLRRQVITASHRINGYGYDTSMPASEVLEKSQGAIFDIAQEQKRTGFEWLEDTLSRTYQEMQARATHQISPGIPCGFYDLDAMTAGFQRGDLIILAGRPSMGKTAFAMSIARSVSAYAEEQVVAIFSLEMSKEQLALRLLSNETQIEGTRIKSGRITENEWEEIINAHTRLAELPICIEDSPNVTVNQMKSQLRQLKAEKGDIGLVIIDYLQLMEGGSDNRVQELSKITRQLKGLARELNVPIIALSQLSRAVESRTNKRPIMSDLRESGGIEQEADLIIMLYRDEYYNPETTDRAIAEVIIAKHRNGPTGVVKLLFDAEFARFRNLVKSSIG